MASYTSNYQLHQWVPEDDFLRTDFNTDFQKIDAAIRAAKAQAEGLASSKAEVVIGQYTGNGAETRIISLGFYPRLVLLENRSGDRGIEGNIEGGMVLRGSSVFYSNNLTPTLLIVSNGFQVHYHVNNRSYTNTDGMIYHYLALK